MENTCAGDVLTRLEFCGLLPLNQGKSYARRRIEERSKVVICHIQRESPKHQGFYGEVSS